MVSLTLLIAVVFTAIVFDYINGFHDAANAIATVVSTNVLHIRTAVILAAILNFAGALAGTAVAKTISSGLAEPQAATQLVVLSALIAASLWNLLTWWFGIPSSSSHALIGGIAGAVVANAGFSAFHFNKLVEKVLVPLVASPLLGFFMAFFLMVALTWMLRRVRAATVNRGSRVLQLLSASLMAFSHGSNDAQKSMGAITMALLAYMALPGASLPLWVQPHNGNVPQWVVLACAGAIAAGTMAGGKRIIRTMGSKMLRITPIQGFAAELSGATIIQAASHLGIPVSTTHCINAAIMGVGASKRLSAVRWGVATNILIAWVLTLPVSAALAYVICLVLKLFA